MSVKTETMTTYICDRCGVTSDKPFRYSGSVRMSHDLHDYQGAAVAGWKIDWDLCDICTRQTADFLRGD